MSSTRRVRDEGILPNPADMDGNELPCPEDCPAKSAPLFEEIDDVAIPQWSGMHDRLTVYNRVRP